jgi:hypothetical protein
MRSPFQMRVPALQQPERADRNNFYLYLYKAINQSLFLSPTTILTCRKTSPLTRVLVIAVINLGCNFLGAPSTKCQQIQPCLPPPPLHARRTRDRSNLLVIVCISHGATSCDQRTQRLLSRNHGWSDIKDDGQDLRIERDAPAHAGS